MEIAILLYPGFTALNAIGPAEVFSSLQRARVSFVAEKAGRVLNDTGILSVPVQTTLADLPAPEVIVVPGGPGCYAAGRRESVLAWLRQAAATARWTTSVCTGALILGAAGLLRGARATTHWNARDELAASGATYVPERYVRHGSLVTAAGVSAGLDMALFVARELTDLPTAQAIQLALEYDPQPPLPMITPPARTEDVTIHQLRVMLQRANTAPRPVRRRSALARA
ncbi:MAG: DJ-1/PfpI family protein [Anaerolineales bacterium]|nr:DJ-1/PfpI family protein [Anaerolineales bacterium]